MTRLAREHILQLCLEDWENVVAMGKKSWIRRCGMDIVAKFLVLLINSFGRRGREKTVYVDEVNNLSMRENLRKTAAITHGENARFLVFNRIEHENHCRTGAIWTAGAILGVAIASSFLVALFAGKKEGVNRRLMVFLIWWFEQYVSRLADARVIVLMSDHHFFSAVAAMQPHLESVVLQHGLIQDERFYKPIRANHFFAWSEKSVSLVCSRKAIPTGTYKFTAKGCWDNASATFASAKKVLLCLSSSKSVDEIQKRLDPLLLLQEKYGFDLMVKMHPGSMFSFENLKRSTCGQTIELYKEERIEDLDFDFAVVEQSTAVLDVICLSTPLVILGDCGDGYFNEYRNLIPLSFSSEEEVDLIESFSIDRFRAGYELLKRNEISGSGPTIRECLLRLEEGGRLPQFGG